MDGAWFSAVSAELNRIKVLARFASTDKNDSYEWLLHVDAAAFFYVEHDK